MAIKVVLWDIDGTLLDFEVAEKNAINSCFVKHHLGQCTDAMLADYMRINRGYWERLERGELTKKQVLEGRFYEFFEKYHLNTDCAPDFNASYQLALGDTICFCPNGLETVKALKKTVRQYAVTNGTAVAQKKKLAASGLDRLLDGAFISDEMGVEKPNVLFFDKVFKEIGINQKSEILIVGDSLTSDMLGGNRAGIRCCWYNPKKEKVPSDLHLDYHITDLNDVLKICRF